MTKPPNKYPSCCQGTMQGTFFHRLTRYEGHLDETEMKWGIIPRYLEDHPRTCKWSGSPPIYTWKGYNPILRGLSNHTYKSRDDPPSTQKVSRRKGPNQNTDFDGMRVVSCGVRFVQFRTLIFLWYATMIGKHEAICFNGLNGDDLPPKV